MKDAARKGEPEKKEEIKDIVISREEEKKKATLIMVSSLLVGIVIVFVGLVLSFGSSSSFAPLIVLFGVLVMTLPYSLYSYFKFSEMDKIESAFPQFLRDFAEDKKSGMTFPEALMSRKDTDYGPLSKYIRKAANQLSWGVPFETVMQRLANSLSSSQLIEKSFAIINEAFNAGGNVGELMTTLASDVRTLKDLDDERRSVMSSQIATMYFIFFFFLVIVVMLYKLLVPMISENSLTMGFGGGEVTPPDYCNVAGFVCSVCPTFGFQEGNLCYFGGLFFFMAMIQAVCNGLIAGEIGSGSISAGVKHTIIMISLAFVAFMVFM